MKSLVSGRQGVSASPVHSQRSWGSSVLFLCGASGQHIDLQQTGDSMHSVEDAEWQADVDDGRPEGVTVKVYLHGIAEVRAGAEGRHDP